MIDFINKYKKDIIIPSAVLLIICIIIPLALAGTNMLTANRIKELEIKNQNAAMNSLISADNFTKEKSDNGNFEYFVATSEKKIKGYIFITYQNGYGGNVSVMTAVNTDGTIKSVSILDASNETPGLGQNVLKKDFYSQYNGKKYGVSLLKNGADSKKNEVDAVTGATITSTAVNEAINKALNQYEEVVSKLLVEEVPDDEE